MKAARRARRALLVGGVCLAVVVGLRLLPARPLGDGVPMSVSVYDRSNQRLLRLGLAADGQYRLWTPFSQIAPALIEATLLYEDRGFYRHPGVNPIALVRAMRATYGGGARVGGS